MAEFATNGKGNLGVALGAIGTGLGVIGPHVGNLFGWGNGYNGYGYGYGRNAGFDNGYAAAYCIDRPVGKETFELQQRVSRLESEKSLIESEQHTEVKIADAYERVAKQALELERKENDKWTNQLVWNAHQDSRIAVLESKVHELMSLTGRYVEASHVTPYPMARFNHWETPIATGATPAPATT